MLVDPPIQEFTEEQLAIAKEENFDADELLPHKEQPGVYMGHLNCENHFVDGYVMHINDSASRSASRELSQRYEAKEITLQEYMVLDEETSGWYGVADNIEQIIRFYSRQVEDPEKGYVLVVTPIFREHQPKRDGWRWHKWGEYIGTQEQRHEYLYDETHIDHVLVYHLYSAKGAEA